MNSVGIQPADFVIAPDVTSFDISEFTRADEMARIGEATTDATVAQLHKMLNRLDSKPVREFISSVIDYCSVCSAENLLDLGGNCVLILPDEPPRHKAALKHSSLAELVVARLIGRYEHQSRKANRRI